MQLAVTFCKTPRLHVHGALKTQLFDLKSFKTQYWMWYPDRVFGISTATMQEPFCLDHILWSGLKHETIALFGDRRSKVQSKLVHLACIGRVRFMTLRNRKFGKNKFNTCWFNPTFLFLLTGSVFFCMAQMTRFLCSPMAAKAKASRTNFQFPLNPPELHVHMRNGGANMYICNSEGYQVRQKLQVFNNMIQPRKNNNKNKMINNNDNKQIKSIQEHKIHWKTNVLLPAFLGADRCENRTAIVSRKSRRAQAKKKHVQWQDQSSNVGGSNGCHASTFACIGCLIARTACFVCAWFLFCSVLPYVFLLLELGQEWNLVGASVSIYIYCIGRYGCYLFPIGRLPEPSRLQSPWTCGRQGIRSWRVRLGLVLSRVWATTSCFPTVGKLGFDCFQHERVHSV